MNDNFWNNVEHMLRNDQEIIDAAKKFGVQLTHSKQEKPQK